MTIDTTINLGNLLTALLAIVAFVISFTKMGGRIDLLSQRVKAMEDAIKGHGDIGTRVAVMEARQATNSDQIATLQKDMHDLRHGRGFVAHRSHGGVDGEYP